MTTINHKEYNAIMNAHKLFALYASRNKELKSLLKTNSNWRSIIKICIDMAKSDLQNAGHELAKIFLSNVYFGSINHKLTYQLAVETYS